MKLLQELPHRLHHYAYVVRDHEANRRFFEDLLGIPLVATWCERSTDPEVGDYCHAFYAMADGSALAFFQFANEAMYEKARMVEPPIGRYNHISLKVSRPAFDEIVSRLDAAEVAHREIDHGYCLSTYLTSPDGLRVEFTVDPPNVAAIDAMRRADAHAELARWLGGDRRINNEDRPR